MAERKKLLVMFGILAVGFLGVFAMQLGKPRVEARELPTVAPLVRALEVRPEPVQFVVHAQGTVRPRSEGDLVPQVSGEVVWTSPSLVSGGTFEQGDALVRIDPADYEAEVESAKAAVSRTQSEFRRARTERERQRRLADQSATSQSRIDDAENAHRVANASLREARARLARAQRDLARCVLTAPYAGRVREENVDTGQFVSRGASIGRIYAIDFAEVRLPVPDRELAFLDLSGIETALRRPEGAASGAERAPRVRLHAEYAGQPRTWSARLVRTEGEIDPRSRMVNVVARVEDPYGRASDAGAAFSPLTVGLFVDAEIEGIEVPQAFVLPRSALRERRSPDGERIDQAYLVGADGRLEFRAVDVLRRERERIVIAAGLQAGDRVLVSPLRMAVEGMLVRVAEPAPGDAEALRAADGAVAEGARS